MKAKAFAWAGAVLMSLALAAGCSRSKKADTTPAAKPAMANPCGGGNPCGGDGNPCGGNPCGGNPCGGNPCGGN